MSDFDGESEGMALSEWLDDGDQFDDEPRAHRRNKRISKPKRAEVAQPKSSCVVVTKPGVYDMPEDEYHADPVPEGSLSQSSAKLLLKSPALYRWRTDHREPPTDAMRFGTAVHAMILGTGTPTVIPADVLGKGESKTTNAYKEWAAGHDDHALKPSEWAQVQAIVARVREHADASRLLAEGVAEQSYFWQRDGVWLRARLDWFTPGGTIVDYKSTVDVSPEGFRKQAYNLSYFLQPANYLDAVESCTFAPAERFVFIAQEKTPPYQVCVFEPDDDFIDYGRFHMDRAIDLYRQCKETDTWPGYPAAATLSLPRWAA